MVRGSILDGKYNGGRYAGLFSFGSYSGAGDYDDNGFRQVVTPQTIAFKYSNTAWTGSNVTVTLSTGLKGYTIQYSKDGGAWTNYTGGVIFTDNGTINARLWNGTNAGTVVTGNVSNIDKSNPVYITEVIQGATSITFSAGTNSTGAPISRYGIYKVGDPYSIQWIILTEPTYNLNNVTITGLGTHTLYEIVVMKATGAQASRQVQL